MLSLFVTLLTLAVIAIPILFVVKIAGRLRQVSQGISSDPARLQRVFAEHAAAALRRAGADPKAVAKVEMLAHGPAVARDGERHAAAYEARIGLQRKGAYAAQTRPPAVAAPEPESLFEAEAPRAIPAAPPRPAPQHAPYRRPRPRHHPPVAPLGGLDMGDSFRLAEPPDISEPHGPVRLSANWLALAALAGAVAYYALSWFS